MKKRTIRESADERVFDAFVYALLIFALLVTLYPIYYVVCASFSDNVLLRKDPEALLWPKGFTTGAYRYVFDDSRIYRGFLNTLLVMLGSLPLSMALTLMTGYFMSCRGLMFKKPLMWALLFTMYFSGGLIPGYLNIRDLGLYNTLWALILPGALSIYNSIICCSAIDALPDSLLDSAYIDGARDFTILFRIITPLILPTLAVLLMYYGVEKWNEWFRASIYISSGNKLPLQNIVRDIVGSANTKEILSDSDMDSVEKYRDTVKYATIVVTTAPIMCIYPFLQKYFVKGALLGAVKE